MTGDDVTQFAKRDMEGIEAAFVMAISLMGLEAFKSCSWFGSKDLQEGWSGD